MTTETIWSDPNGKEWRSLPRTWNGTTNITERWAKAHGWTYREEEIQEVPEVKTYSKLRLHLALEKAGLWDTVWNSLDARMHSYWNDCQELSSEDEFFAKALADLKERLGVSEDKLQELLEEARK